ncbi:MAG TPA: flagellar hook-basal body complex protein FliE [Gammaproteobacteria bacterium]|nr:flagellar hook-basal body complex protein FliE [Gammaproteobacteria bacterium]
MNTIDTNQLLTQLRTAAAQAQGQQTEAAAPAAKGQDVSFSSLMEQSLDKVNELQQTSGDLKTAFQKGDPNVSLPEVALAGQKAGIAFQTTLHVRNKVVEAYKEIMRMQV